MRGRYKVLKECVIECAHFDVGQEYTPVKMTSEALDKFIEYGFLELVKDEPWEPKKGDTYWVVCENGDVNYVYAEGETGTKSRVAMGNCFQTEEQAKKAVEWLRAFKVLRGDTKGFKPDWKEPDQDKFMVFYDNADKYLGIIKHWGTQAELIIFATEVDARESIEKHKKEWLTFLGVKDDNE